MRDGSARHRLACTVQELVVAGCLAGVDAGAVEVEVEPEDSDDAGLAASDEAAGFVVALSVAGVADEPRASVR